MVHKPVSTLHHRGHAPLTHVVQGTVFIRIGVRPQGIIRALGSPTPLGLGYLEHAGTFVPVVHHLCPQPVPRTLGCVHRSVLVAGHVVGCVRFVGVTVNPVRQAATARVVNVARLAGARTDLLPVIAVVHQNLALAALHPVERLTPAGGGGEELRVRTLVQVLLLGPSGDVSGRCTTVIVQLTVRRVG